MIKVHVPLPQNPYDIIIERNLLTHINNYIDISRQFVIITDENIPKQYLNQILTQIPKSLVLEVPQ